ncbi:MAG: hypothetical protein G8345_12085 [Magnetococcales bacterium]|nr:hypothetical protein [Magnetococcales bacterium]NGZ27611.1 hypothetical protein [Magnetococcales bacterium]
MATQRTWDDTFANQSTFPETRKLCNSAEEDCRKVNNAIEFPPVWLHTMCRTLQKNKGVALVGHIHNGRMADYMWAMAINQVSSLNPL